MSAHDVLVPFGFTALESQVYGFLITESPATGYRIAQGIGKPVANVYKAIQSLAEKNALVVESAESRLVHPVPPEELLARLTREFDARKKAAEAAFAEASVAGAKDRIQTIKSLEQSLDTATELVRAATHSILFSGTKAAVEALESELRAASARGISVSIKTAAPCRVEGAEIVAPLRDEDLWAQWPEEGMVVCVDGGAILAAQWTVKGVVKSAIFAQSTLLGTVLYQGMSADHCITEIEERLEDGAGPKRVLRTIASMRSATGTPAFQKG
jgi:sugar-specific transcriptional regulator TrmB